MKLSALVVDDEIDLRETICELIVQAGFEATPAADGEAALAFLEKNPAQLVICDISMPGLTGLQTLQKIRDRGLACAVVMLTAHSEKERIIQALQLGAIDYVTKPFEVAVLLEKIPVWLAMGQRLQDIANHSESTGADLQKQLRLIELFQAEANKTDSD